MLKLFVLYNLDGVFRLILLIYGQTKYEKYESKHMWDNLRNSVVASLTKIDFCNRFRKLSS